MTRHNDNVTRSLALAALGALAATALVACAPPVGVLVRHRTPALVASDLGKHRLCLEDRDPVSGIEAYQPCRSVGSRDFVQWATASYDQAEMLVAVDRYERWIDEPKALTRWNTLVERAIDVYGSPTEASRERATSWQLVPPSALYWSAHQVGASVVVLAYLTPTAPHHAHIVEVVGFDARTKIARPRQR
ncbi:MAG: hypothetical protein IPL79_08405 [Myxococcales bacterium]|nr:hypothetical protein [Myxococcales bacterium]